MNGFEATPSQTRHHTRVPIGLDADQRLNLLHELRSLSSDLEETFIEPEQDTRKLTGIQLLPLDKHSHPAYMSIETTKEKGMPQRSTITVADSRRAHNPQQRSYIHRPSHNVWEEWRPGATEATRFMESSTIVGMLEPQLPEHTLESMMDTVPEGGDIALLLADHLKKRARNNTRDIHYAAHGALLGSLELAPNLTFARDTDFIVRRRNNIVQRHLFVTATFDLLDHGIVHKTYGYDVVDRNGSLESTYGTIQIAASTAVPKIRLAAFAHRDALRNEAAQGIDTGVKDIRKAYEIE